MEKGKASCFDTALDKTCKNTLLSRGNYLTVHMRQQYDTVDKVHVEEESNTSQTCNYQYGLSKREHGLCACTER